MKTKYLELYTDYLMVNTTGYATATGLSSMMEGEISHDQITRLLSKQDFSSKHLWKKVKSTVRQVESEEACLIFDDTIQEKQWTDVVRLSAGTMTTSKDALVRGVNLLNVLYYSSDVSIPVAFEVIRKPIQFSEIATRKVKRANIVTKNDKMR